jgi:hypothetical protein
VGHEDGPRRESPVIGYLIVAARVPVGLLGALLVALFFAVWFALEIAVALIAFPVAAVTANQAWIRGSWLGRFPIALREFSRERFKYMRVIWTWVADPAQAVDLNIEGGGGTSAATPVAQEAPAAPPAQNSWRETALGVLGWAVILIVIGVVIKGCS